MSSLLRTVRNALPPSFVPAATEAFLTLRALPYLGTAKICPCCGWHLRDFMRYHNPEVTRALPVCPRCQSIERHRWVWLYLHEHAYLASAHLRLLHFAPEYCYARRFQHMPNIKWVSTDLKNNHLVEVQQDITRLAFPDEAFDAILCSHVLEHVPDDRRAMRELFRVLKPGGWAVLNTPVRMDQLTYEDASITTPEARIQAFGQWDHVRWYGMDYIDRLLEAGFAVTVLDARDLLPEQLERYGLRETEVMFFCTRPAV